MAAPRPAMAGRPRVAGAAGRAGVGRPGVRSQARAPRGAARITSPAQPPSASARDPVKENGGGRGPGPVLLGQLGGPDGEVEGQEQERGQRGEVEERPPLGLRRHPRAAGATALEPGGGGGAGGDPQESAQRAAQALGHDVAQRGDPAGDERRASSTAPARPTPSRPARGIRVKAAATRRRGPAAAAATRQPNGTSSRTLARKSVREKWPREGAGDADRRAAAARVRGMGWNRNGTRLAYATNTPKAAAAARQARRAPRGVRARAAPASASVRERNRRSASPASKMMWCRSPCAGWPVIQGTLFAPGRAASSWSSRVGAEDR